MVISRAQFRVARFRGARIELGDPFINTFKICSRLLLFILFNRRSNTKTQ